MSHRRLRSLLGGVAALMSSASALWAQTPLAGLQLSPDVTAAIGALSVADEDLIQDDLAEVEKKLSAESVASVDAVTAIGQYLQSSGGKRLRPLRAP